jgi:hypothetical protein
MSQPFGEIFDDETSAWTKWWDRVGKGTKDAFFDYYEKVLTTHDVTIITISNIEGNVRGEQKLSTKISDVTLKFHLLSKARQRCVLDRFVRDSRLGVETMLMYLILRGNAEVYRLKRTCIENGKVIGEFENRKTKCMSFGKVRWLKKF